MYDGGMGNVAELRAAVARAILEGKGKTSAGARRAAFDGAAAADAPPAVQAYVTKIRDTAYQITDEDVAALRAAGLGDDEIFELSVAAAVGQATRQYASAERALEAALAARKGAA